MVIRPSPQKTPATCTSELLLLLHSQHNSSSASAACQATTLSSSTASHRPMKNRATTAPPAAAIASYATISVAYVFYLCLQHSPLSKPNQRNAMKNVECPTYQSGVGGACPITHLRAPINAKDYTTIKWATLTICAIE